MTLPRTYHEADKAVVSSPRSEHELVAPVDNTTVPSSRHILGADVSMTSHDFPSTSSKPSPRSETPSSGQAIDANDLNDNLDCHNVQSSSPQPTDSCGCLGKALAVLERFEAHQQQASRQKADELLSLQRQAIERCNAFIACGLCTKVSHSAMVLLMLCEKCFASSQLLIRIACNFRVGSQNAQADRGICGRSDAYVLGTERILYGDYEVSTRVEQVEVLEALLRCFLQCLLSFLARFERLAIAKGWRTQSTMVIDLRDRMHSACQTLSSK